VLYRSAKRIASSSPAEVVMSPLSITATEQPKALSFQPAEEKWFASRGRKHGRPLRASLTPPPAPIGDALADAWFR